METILAIKLKDAVITLTDRNSGRSIVKVSPVVAIAHQVQSINQNTYR